MITPLSEGLGFIASIGLVWTIGKTWNAVCCAMIAAADRKWGKS